MKIIKFKQTLNFNYYTIVFIISLFIIFFLYRKWHIDKRFLGVVEKKSHFVGAQEPGKMYNELINIGDKVKKDQVLAILDMSDLKTTLNQLKSELNKIRSLEGSQHEQFSIIAYKTALQLENEASDIINNLSEIEAKSTELVGLNVEIKRLKNAEEAGLGHSRNMSELILQRDALAAYLKEQSKDFDNQKQQLEKTKESRKLLKDVNLDSLTNSMLTEQIQYTESLQRQISEIKHRLKLRTISSPCDGYVTEIFSYRGDIVEEFVPILKVEELTPRFVDIYIPETSSVLPVIGAKVDIFSSRKREFDTQGTITFIHPGISQASNRLFFRGQIIWARKIRVKLPENHFLIPGEVITSRVLSDKKNKGLFSVFANGREDSNTQKNNYPDVKNIEVPASLSKTTRFEPSGISWLNEKKKYLIISDDTGIKNLKNDHAPYLFFMDENGVIDSSMVILSGIKTINDLEAIVPLGENDFYLISSQNISKKNKRPSNRELILKVKTIGNKYIVEKKAYLLSLILNSYSKEQLFALGLEQLAKDGKPILNIEGATYHNNALYFGLKEPVSDNGAIILKLDNVDSIFQNQKLLPNQLTVLGRVNLGKIKKKYAGISDLMFDDQGILWALSTYPNTAKDEQVGGFHRINSYVDGRLVAERIFTFPGKKPEGLCQQSDSKFLIVFDNDNETPAFCYIDRNQL